MTGEQAEDISRPQSKESEFIERLKEASDKIDANWSGSEDPMETEKPNSITSLPSPSTASEVSSPVLRPGAYLNLMDDTATPMTDRLMDVERSIRTPEKCSQNTSSFRLVDSPDAVRTIAQHCNVLCKPVDCLSFASAVGKAFDSAKLLSRPSTLQSNSNIFAALSQQGRTAAVSTKSPFIQPAAPTDLHPSGADWVTRRLRDRSERSGTGECVAAQLRRLILRLRAALPTEAPACAEAQSRFLATVRRYVDGKGTPEDFAEAILTMVDDYQVPTNITCSCPHSLHPIIVGRELNCLFSSIRTFVSSCGQRGSDASLSGPDRRPGHGLRHGLRRSRARQRRRRRRQQQQQRARSAPRSPAGASAAEARLAAQDAAANTTTPAAAAGGAFHGLSIAAGAAAAAAVAADEGEFASHGRRPVRGRCPHRVRGVVPGLGERRFPPRSVS
jgi:hypothetical protein